ncbi:MAG: hypothetical protein WBA88_21185 [Pseudaminobacter sp.]
MSAQQNPDAFLASVDKLMLCDTGLTHLQAGLLAAAHFDIAHDSRSFASRIEVAHALVLRELNELAETRQLLRITKRDAYTLRSYYALEEEGERLCALSDKLEILPVRA